MKYIIFDLDDTLLNDSSQITDYTLAALKRLQSLGHKLVINTARSRLYNKPYFDRLKPDYAILNGGAVILDRDGLPVFRCEIPKKTVAEFAAELLSLGKKFSVQSDGFVYSNEEYFVRPDVRHCDFSTFSFDFDAPKLLVQLTEEEKDYFAKKYDLSATFYFGGPITRFNNKGASKAKANRALLSSLGADIGDAIVFGDDLGDIEMILEAGVGVIMKNASESLKAKCKRVTEFTNNEDGVAKFLEKYFGI